jgi:hypothetical protein
MSGSGEESNRDPLVELFIEHASWFAKHIPFGTRGTVFDWVFARLSTENVEKMRTFFRIDRVEQREAEKAVAEFFEREERPTVERREWATTTKITRTTDWARTYEQSITSVPTEYCSREVREVPDERLLSSLAGLARQWLILLGKLQEGDGDYQSRIDRLRNAVPNRFLGSAYEISFGPEEMRRLRRSSSETAAKLEPVRRFWSRGFGEEDEEALRNLAGGIDRSDVKNDDTLLELVAALSVARAAVEGADSPIADAWEIERVEIGSGKYPSIVLASDQLRCEIAKGQPGAMKRRETTEDRLIEVFEKMGLNSTGHEPDLLLKFWRVGSASDSVFALGDAKRNESNDGDDYIRTSIKGTATAYMAAFGHLAGLTMRESRDGAFEQRLEPAVTLFFRQGISAIDDIPADQTEDIVECFNDDARSLPPIVGFDHRHMAKTGEEDEWKAPVLNAWFRRLARGARELLEG